MARVEAGDENYRYSWCSEQVLQATRAQGRQAAYLSSPSGIREKCSKGTRIFTNTARGAARRLSSRKHLLLFWRTRAPFPVPTWWVRTLWNSRPRGSDTFLWPLWASMHSVSKHRRTQKSHTHKINESIKCKKPLSDKHNVEHRSNPLQCDSEYKVGYHRAPGNLYDYQLLWRTLEVGQAAWVESLSFNKKGGGEGGRGVGRKREEKERGGGRRRKRSGERRREEEGEGG